MHKLDVEELSRDNPSTLFCENKMCIYLSAFTFAIVCAEALTGMGPNIIINGMWPKNVV